ncbi:MAG: hypothetical protein FWG64_07755, partial [Firmicutes bacterium]|nr:hypothetical protein [Bacillota bacterium]
MRYTRIVRDENAVSFREYIESIERRRVEDLARYEKDREKADEERKIALEILEQRRQEDLAKYEKDRAKADEERKLDLAKYEKDREKAEERYNLDRKDWQERYTEAKKENTQAYKNL